MKHEDITPQVEHVSSTQEEAIENLKGAKQFKVPPEVFKEHKTELKAEAQKAALPKMAAAPVARMIASSPEHAAAVAPEAAPLSKAAKIFKDIGTKVNNVWGEPQEERELNWKKLNNDDKLDPDEEDRLIALRVSGREAHEEGEELSFMEGLPGDVISGLVDVGAGLWREKDTVIDMSMAGSVTGGTLGALTGNPVAMAGGALTGAGVGLFGAGIPLAGLKDSYKMSAASVYGELDSAVDDVGEPLNIDKETKRYISHGVGIVSGVLSFGSDKLMLKNMPFLKKFMSPKAATEFITNPVNRPLRDAMVVIGKNIATNAGEEGLQEIVQIIGEAIGGTYKDGEASFTNGLLNATDKLTTLGSPEQKRVGGAMVVGGLVAGTLTGSSQAAVSGVQKVEGKLQDRKVKKAVEEVKKKIIKEERDKLLDPKTVYKTEKRIKIEQKFLDPNTTYTPVSDVIETATPEKHVENIMYFNQAVDAASKIIDSTKVGQDPEMKSEVRRKIIDEIGIRNIYLDQAALTEIITEPTHLEKIRQSFGPQNTPVAMPIHEFFDLRDQYPTIQEHARLHPEGPNAKAGKAHVEKMVQAEQQRAEVRKKLGSMELPVEERAKNVKLTPDADDKTLMETLGTQEVADAYLTRLDQNEAEVKAQPGPGDQEQLANIATMRERVTKLRNQLSDDKTAAGTLKQALETPQPENDVFDEPGYLNQDTFTKPIEGVLSSSEIARVNSAQRMARERVAETIRESAQFEMNKVIDVVAEAALETEEQIELEKLADNPRINLVERFVSRNGDFRQTARYQTVEDLTAAQRPRKNSKIPPSIYAMDPELLTPEQKEKYLNSPLLKEHGALVKGGMHPEDAAIVLGVKDGETLLNILSTTRRWEDAARDRVKAKEQSVREKAADSVEVNKIALAEAYHNLTRNHIEEMKILKDERWTAVKAGIKRIALPLPKIEVLTRNARNAVAKTKVGDLNPNLFKVGERRSQRMAVEAVLKNDIVAAFVNKEAAALNVELGLATHQAIARVNRALRLAKKFRDPKVIAELKEAGPLYYDAAMEILDVFNLNPSMKDQAELGAFKKFVKEQIAAGVADFSVPDRLSDVREHVNEMTVEELLTASERLQALYTVAKRKNKLLLKYGEKARTFEKTRREIVQLLKSNPDYDEKRALEKPDENLGATERLFKRLQGFGAALKNSEHLLTKAGNDQIANVLVTSIIGPLKGGGRFQGMGEQGKADDMLLLGKQFGKIINGFIGSSAGKKKMLLNEWENLRNEYVDVPEWADNPLLYNGRLNKGQLLMMLLNGGNEGNSTRLAENYNTDMGTIRKVLDRELEERHAVAAQQIMDLFASYYPRVTKLHEEMTGVIPEFVEAVEFTHKGRVYPGGYFPIVAKTEMDYEKIRKRNVEAVKKATGEERFELSGDQFSASDMTKHNHTEKRTSSTQPISLDMDILGMLFESVIHDLNFRKPIHDGLKIVTDPQIAKALTSTMGEANYNVIVNMLVDAGQSVQMENNRLHTSNKIMDQLQAKMRSSISVGSLVASLPSLGMQFVSFPLAVNRMGPTGLKHVAAILKEMASNPANLAEMYDIAGEMVPAIRQSREGYDDNTRDAISKMMPKSNWRAEFGKKKTNVLSPLAPMNVLLDKTVEAGFQPFAWIDNAMKVAITNAAVKQFLEGDAEGYSYEQVMAMTPEERKNKAQAYASSLVRLTLTTGTQVDRADIQKRHKNIAMFFNDARNTLANMAYMKREIARKSKGEKKIRRGTEAVIRTAIVLMTMKLVEEFVRNGILGIWDEDMNVEDNSTALGYRALTAPVDIITSNIPVIRDIKWAAQSDQWFMEQFGIPSKNTPTTPIVQMLKHSKTAYVTLSNFMDNINNEAEMSTEEKKAFLFTGSALLTGGRLPVKAIMQGLDIYNSVEIKPGFEIGFTEKAEAFKEQVQEFKQIQEQLPEAERVPQEVVDHLDEAAQAMDPAPMMENSELIPQGTYDIIKQIESRGQWWAENPNSSAAGLYQFTQETWDWVMKNAPDLELTDNGRVSEDTSQQERVMRWFTEYNAGKLAENNIEPSIENLYAAHFLGHGGAIKVLNGDPDAKLRSYVSEGVMTANGFKNSMKVKDFKAWVIRKVDKATSEIANVDTESETQED